MFNKMYAKCKLNTAKKVNECISEGREAEKTWEMVAHDEMESLGNKYFYTSLSVFGMAFFIMIVSTLAGIYNDVVDFIILMLIAGGLTGFVFTFVSTYVIHRRLKAENPHRGDNIAYD